MYKFRVKELRESIGVTQHDVFSSTGIQPTTYRNIEKNRITYCKFEFLFKLRDYFKLSSIDELFYFNDGE